MSETKSFGINRSRPSVGSNSVFGHILPSSALRQPTKCSGDRPIDLSRVKTLGHLREGANKAGGVVQAVPVTDWLTSSSGQQQHFTGVRRRSIKCGHDATVLADCAITTRDYSFYRIYRIFCGIKYIEFIEYLSLQTDDLQHFRAPAVTLLVSYYGNTYLLKMC